MYDGRVSIPSASQTYSVLLGVGSESAELVETAVGAANANTFNILHHAWISLLADSSLGYKPIRTIEKFRTEFSTDPIKLIAKLSDLAHKIRKNLCVKDGITSIKEFLVEMKDTPIFKEYLHFYRTQDYKTLRYILTFLEFGKKISYENPELQATALRGWFKVEERLASLKLPDWTASLREVVKFVMREWSSDTVFPKHGTGAVSQKGISGLRQKNDSMYIPDKMRYTYFRCNNIFYQEEYMDVSPTGSNSALGGVGLECSRLHFVPKTYKTFRTICMEPIPYMWMQQAVRLWLEEAIALGPLGRHVRLANQEHNQNLARLGSIHRTYDTIDLSSASDSIAWTLVRLLFPAKVLRHLLATRTDSVTIGDVLRMEVQKFAPMGSAVCFPIQSIIFSSVVIYVSLCKTYNVDFRNHMWLNNVDVEAMYNTVYPQRPRKNHNDYVPFSCYGDDIITDSRLTGEVIDALIELGFDINRDKSFVGKDTSFRESCGKEYFNGNDVSPMKLKLKTITKSMKIDALGGLIDQINQAYNEGYSNMRRALISVALYHPIEGVKVPKARRNPILFSENEDESFAIFHSAPRNIHLRRRDYNPESDIESSSQLYQRDEVRSISVGPKGRRKHRLKHEPYAYNVYWRAKKESFKKIHEDFTRNVSTFWDEEVVEPLARFDTLRIGVRWRWTAT